MSSRIDCVAKERTISCLRHLAENGLFQEEDREKGCSLSGWSYHEEDHRWVNGELRSTGMTSRQVNAAYHMIQKYKDILVATGIEFPEGQPFENYGYQKRHVIYGDKYNSRSGRRF